ncbi:MAG: NYN domain-containing protein [Candidatus Omnitrophica bacterium]|nr:NYN domain-containing protein [Candidatus Omnitrophota bacterium]
MGDSKDVSSITPDSPQILKQFIRAPLLQKMSIEAIEYLNTRLKELNQQGILYIEDLKCNFDVEIGRDMLLDYRDNKIENFILWSGDSDFADPVRQLLSDNKKVVLFATARRVSVELNEFW